MKNSFIIGILVNVELKLYISISYSAIMRYVLLVSTKPAVRVNFRGFVLCSPKTIFHPTYEATEINPNH